MTNLRKAVSTSVILALLLVSIPSALAAPPHQDAACNGTDYSVQANDWLSKLAEKNLGDILAYPDIVEATNTAATVDDSYATIENPDVIEIGWKLCIPSAEGDAMAADSSDGEATAEATEDDGEAMADTSEGDGEATAETTEDDGEAMADTTIVNAVTVADQTLGEGNTVTIAQVSADADSWIVIHAQADGRPGPVIGNAAVAAGENTNVVVEIDADAATETLYAMLHIDAGSVGEYEFPGDDVPATDADGNVVTPAFVLTLEEAMMDSEDDAMAAKTSFTVRIENLSEGFTHSASGVFNTPAGASEPGALTPGNAYEFTINAAPGDNLSLATMFVQSNDWFIGTDGFGVPLVDSDGTVLAGDFTDLLLLYDAGTEVDQTPGEGEDQAPRQAGPDTGAADEDNTVRQVIDDTIPAVNELISATITENEDGSITVRLENISDSSSFATPFAPGVWLLHADFDPLFVEGEADLGEGLEALAEDGNPAPLAESLTSVSGRATPFAPVAWVVHTDENPIFTAGEADRGEGLEALAEFGDPDQIATAVGGSVANTPVGADGPNALLPGEVYEFTVEASEGALSFALMYVQSNDYFFAPSGAGIALFDADGNPTSGDVTDQVSLWNAGTEVDEPLGFGPNQAPRQADTDAGEDEGGVVEVAIEDVSGYISVTITPQ